VTSRGGPTRDKHKPRAQNSGERKRRQAEPADWRTATRRGPSTKYPRSEIYSLVTTTDLALLATLIHDAIGHLMNAIDKAARVQAPIDRIADAMEETAATIKSAVAWDDTRMAISAAKARKRRLASQTAR
jgi:hypothetical protein